MAESEVKTEASSLLETKSTETSVASEGGSKTSDGKASLPGWAGGFDNEAKEDLSRRIAADPEFLKNTKGLSDVYRDWVQKSELAKRPTVPDKSAPKEEWDRYYKAIGRPESPDGYAFEKPVLPEGMVYDEAFEKWFRSQAHEVGIPQNQASALFAQYSAAQISAFNGGAKARAESAEKAKAERLHARQAGETQLRADWGTKYDDNLSAAADILKDNRFVSEQGRQKIYAAGLDNEPWFLKLAQIVHAATSADNTLGVDRSTGGKGEPDKAGLQYSGMNKRYGQ